MDYGAIPCQNKCANFEIVITSKIRVLTLLTLINVDPKLLTSNVLRLLVTS